MASTDRTSEDKIIEKISVPKKFILAIQHVFVMNAFIVPVILGSLLGLSSHDSSALIQSTLLVSGIITFLQAKFFMKYPVVYGPSFVPIGAIAGIYAVHGGAAGGWSYVAGASMAGAAAIICVGLTGKFKNILDSLITPVVSGIIVLSIGVSLIPVAFTSMVYKGQGQVLGHNILIALVTMAVMVIFSILGLKQNKLGSISRTGSCIFALLAGVVVAQIVNPVDVSAINASPWILRPALPFVDFGIKFDLVSVITMIVLYFIMMTENTGTWIATSSATDTDLHAQRLNKGVVGIGISNAIGALFGSTPQSAYSSNIGILTITDVYSKHVFSFVGLMLVLIGCSGKLSACIATLPSAAVGGIFLLTCGIIASAGIDILKSCEINLKQTYMIASCLVVAIGLNILPAGSLETLPSLVKYLLGSPIASSALLAIVLNKLIPETI